jgi:adenosine deaminase CECR1
MGYRDDQGKVVPPEVVAGVIRERLSRRDVQALDLTVRFQQAILRFLPNAESQLEAAYRIVSREPEWVGINLVGREDDERGQPKRFLETFRAMRRTYPDVRLSIHAGESEVANHNIRDTLSLGADRIGHGLNLLTDLDTFRSMRHGPYLVEINLISNLLLEYVESFERHPFPELLRTGVPVALSTDDRGMWDSSMTDEYFVAVKNFQLNWAEIKTLSENSLRYAFVDKPVQQAMLDRYAQQIRAFESQWRIQETGLRKTGAVSPKRGFVCRKYALCALP